LHNFRDIAFHRSKIAIFGYPSFLCFTPPTIEGVPLGDLPKNFPWMSTDGQGTKWRRKNAENFKWLSTARALQTDDRQTDDRRKDDSIANVNVSSLKTLLDVGLVNYYYLYFTCRPLCILVSLCVSACDYSLSNSKCIAKDVTYCVYDTIRHDTIRWSILTMSRRPKLTRVGRGLPPYQVSS